MRAVVGAAVLALCAGCASPKYLAKVNHETITGKELRAEFARHHAALEKFLANDADVRKYVGRLVDRRLFVQEAYRIGLHDAPEVRESVARARGNKMIELFLKDEVEARTKVSEDEVRAVHEGLTQQLEVRHVVLATKEEAEAVAAAAAAGEDLEALARTRSISPSAKRGGMLIVAWGGDEAYESVLFGLAEGTIAPVFQSREGWEVARVEKRRTVERPPLEKVAPKIRQALQKRKRHAREEELYSALWSKYGASAQECAPDVEALKAAAARQDQTPCASWRGGAVSVEALAARVKLDELDGTGARWPELRKAVVEDLVNRELVVLEAEERGYAARPEVIERVTVLQDDLVESKLFREYVVKDVVATDEDAKRFFDANPAQFMDEARYELAQILVDTPEIAKEVEAKVRTGQPFAELAAEYSKDRRNAGNGGRVGYLEKGMLKDVFAPIAALEEGQVSGPLRAEDGYHIVKVLSILPARQRPFEVAKEQARARALEEQRRVEVDRWVAKLRAAATIKVSDSGIRAYGKEIREQLRKETEEQRASAAEAAARAAAAAAEPKKPDAATLEAAPPPATEAARPEPVEGQSASDVAPGPLDAPAPPVAPDVSRTSAAPAPAEGSR